MTCVTGLMTGLVYQHMCDWADEPADEPGGSFMSRLLGLITRPVLRDVCDRPDDGVGSSIDV
jgi:hypothetical protein